MKDLNNNIKHTFGKMSLIFLMVLFPCSLKSAITYSYSFDVESLRIDTVESPDGQRFLNISGKNMTPYGEPGHPEIPTELIRFAVPNSATDFSVQISNLEYSTTLFSEIPLCPAQTPISTNDSQIDKFTYPIMDIYRNFSSSIKSEIIEDTWLEGRYHIIGVRVHPIAYHATNNTFEICKSLDISIEYSESQANSSNRLSRNLKNKGLIDIEDIVVNPDLIEKTKSLPDTVSLDYKPKVDKYYIISERHLLNAMEDLVSWKKQKGYKVITKAIEDIYADNRYKVGQESGVVDEAESLRKYLQDEASVNAPFFCLLVGDHHTQIPIRKLKYTDSTIKDTHGICGDAYIPTDNYFSDLFGFSWNLYKDNYGIYVDNLVDVDFSPDIYVGRLLCNSADQVKNYISKLLLYETNPGKGFASYLDNANLFVQYDGMSVYKDVLDEMNETFTFVESFLDTKISDTNTHGYPTGEMMLEKINSCGYVSLMGHGEPSTIACSGRRGHGYDWEYIKALNIYSKETGETQISNTPYDQDSGLDKMTNEGYPSVLYSLACTTEPFDIYDDGFRFDLPHTMASSYTVGGHYGGVAYLGNTRSGYWRYSPEQEKLFFTKR